MYVFTVMGITACGPRPATGASGPIAGVLDSAVIPARIVMDLPHSTLADTAGMAQELRIIERKLGPLDRSISGELVAVEVAYFTFLDSTCSTADTRGTRRGILIVHRCIAEEVKSIFQAMLADTFPIAKVIPINRYGLNADSTGWNDAASMADNNTSAFNYRGKPTSRAPSKHAQGIAIDINPLLNPMVHHRAGGTAIEPPLGRYDPARPGTLTRQNTAKYVNGMGWSWGGRWPKPQDYQHIEKAHGRCAHFHFHLD